MNDTSCSRSYWQWPAVGVAVMVPVFGYPENWNLFVYIFKDLYICLYVFLEISFVRRYIHIFKRLIFS